MIAAFIILTTQGLAVLAAARLCRYADQRSEPLPAPPRVPVEFDLGIWRER